MVNLGWNGNFRGNLEDFLFEVRTLEKFKESYRSLSREEIMKAMKEWNLTWDNHDLEGVMKFFHDEVLFENWTGGKAEGKEALRKAWAPLPLKKFKDLLIPVLIGLKEYGIMIGPF